MNALLALALLATHGGGTPLHWTPPTMQPRMAQYCAADTLLANPVEAYDLFVRGPSPFYLAHRDSMLDNRTPFFAAHWDTVLAQCAPRYVLTVADTTAIVADNDTTHWIDVRPRKRYSPACCPSNLVRCRP